MIKLLFDLSPHPWRDVALPAALCFAAAIVQGGGLALLAPFVMALLDGEIGAALEWLAAMAGALLAYAVIQYQAQCACYRGGINLARDLYEKLSRHILELPLGWFDGGRVGDVSQLASKGVLDVIAAQAHHMRPIIGAFATPVAMMVFMTWFDGRIGLVTLLAAPFLFGAYRLTGWLAAMAEHESHKAASETNARIVEFSNNQAMLRAYDREKLGERLLDSVLERQRRMVARLLRFGLPGMLLFSIALQMFFGAIIGQSAYLVLEGSLPLAVAAALLVLAARFMEPMALAVDLGASVRIAANLATRIKDILETPPLPEPLPAEARTPGVPLTLTFEEVRFSYGGKPVLQGVSFQAEANKVTALVGPSGAGKSTMLQLAARFRDVDAGSIRLGGGDIRDMRSEELVRHVSVVFQNVYLCEGTIRDNILFARNDAPKDVIERAIRLSGVDEILARLPLGLDTPVGESGAFLSGGERQRISIARAILKDAPVLLLDEATSALDAANQRLVMNAVTELRSTKTILVVAHRLGSIETADAIVVLGRDGRVEDMGSHADLLARGGLYRRFFADIKASEGWNLREARMDGRCSH